MISVFADCAKAGFQLDPGQRSGWAGTPVDVVKVLGFVLRQKIPGGVDFLSPRALARSTKLNVNKKM